MEPTTIDPTLMIAGGDRTTVENWGEYLVSREPNGDLKPGLASAWKISTDGKKIDFTLRKGVKFHNGDTLTSRDVAFSFDRQLKKNPQGPSRLNFVERLEVIDDYRLTIHLKMPSVTFIPNRCEVPIASKSYYDKVGEDAFSKTPVGTGPYKVVSYEPGQYIDLERFEGYWGKKPSVKSARFLFIPEDTTRVAKLKTGEADLIAAVPYPMVKDLETTPSLKIIKLAVNHPTPSITFATQNPKVPWHDKRVRLAMAYAIDCDTIIKSLLNGIPNRWAYLAPHELGYDRNLKVYPYDPKRAKALLAEAGYPDGFEFSLYYRLGHRVPMLREMGEAMIGYFQAVGIKTNLVGEEQAANRSRERAAKAKPVEAVYVSWGGGGRAGSVDPSESLYQYFTKEGGFSYYFNPEAETIIQEAKTTMNNAKRGELIKRAVRIVHEDVATIPVFNNVTMYGMKKNINFKPTEKFMFDVIYVKDITVN
jgi:peptide/nickel transport system substrate-binding protein